MGGFDFEIFIGAKEPVFRDIPEKFVHKQGNHIMIKDYVFTPSRNDTKRIIKVSENSTVSLVNCVFKNTSLYLNGYIYSELRDKNRVRLVNCSFISSEQKICKVRTLKINVEITNSLFVGNHFLRFASSPVLIHESEFSGSTSIECDYPLYDYEEKFVVSNSNFRVENENLKLFDFYNTRGLIMDCYISSNCARDKLLRMKDSDIELVNVVFNNIQ